MGIKTLIKNKYRQIQKRKWEKELEDINIEDLIKKSEYINSLCVETYRNYPTDKIVHNLPLKDEKKKYTDPDNWDITDEEKETVIKYMDDLYAYENIISHIFRNCKPPQKVNLTILPPWIVFPAYRAGGSIVWKMGPGESYIYLFSRMIEEMDNDKLKEYKAQYPVPKYMEDMMNRLDLEIIS
jgi:hypothetical protein